MVRSGFAGESEELAAFVLDLDEAGSPGLLLLDPETFRQPQAERGERSRRALREDCAGGVAVALQPVHPEIERRPFQQGGIFLGNHQWIEQRNEPCRNV